MTAAHPAAPALRVDGVLFDVDDTLVDTRGAFVHALAAVARRYLPTGPEHDAEILSVWRADAGGHYAAYTRGEVSHEEQRLARANELHARFGGPALDEASFAEWDGVFDGSFRAAWARHDDADDVVDALLDAGVVVGALTNAAAAYQQAKLEATGLDRVPLLVTVDTLGFGKPDPRVFLEACRRLGTDPARTAYVGDEPDVDAAAARDAGLVGVWLDRPGARRRPVDEAWLAGVTVIRSLSELPAALAA